MVVWRAMRDLLALPSTEWEWEVDDPILRKLKGDLARLGLDVYDQEDEDAKMTAAEIYELFDEYDRQKHEQRETVAHLLARLFSQKLKRDLTEDERQTLRRRIKTLGSERVGGTVLAFDRDALGAWLAQPDAG